MKRERIKPGEGSVKAAMHANVQKPELVRVIVQGKITGLDFSRIHYVPVHVDYDETGRFPSRAILHLKQHRVTLFSSGIYQCFIRTIEEIDEVQQELEDLIEEIEVIE